MAIMYIEDRRKHTLVNLAETVQMLWREVCAPSTVITIAGLCAWRACAWRACARSQVGQGRETPQGWVVARILHSAKGGVVETGCSDLHGAIH